MTVVVPSQKLDGALFETGTCSEDDVPGACAASGRPDVRIARPSVEAPFDDTVIGAGTVNTGGTVSTTVTAKVAVAGVAAGIGRCAGDTRGAERKPRPDLGLHVTGVGPSTRSNAVGSVYVTVLPPASTASTLICCLETVIAGAVVSTTVTVN